jgi:hypothetical protein
LLTSSVVVLYVALLSWDGLTSDTAETCNSWDSVADSASLIAVGLFVLLFALGYVCLRQQAADTEASPIRTAAEPILAKEEAKESQAYQEPDQLVDENYGRNMLYFHGFLLCASFYLSMLLTNWDAVRSSSGPSYSS